MLDDAVHLRDGVCEELLEAAAEIVQPRFPVRGADQPVLRTLAPAIPQIMTWNWLPPGFAISPGASYLSTGRDIAPVLSPAAGPEPGTAGLDAFSFTCSSGCLVEYKLRSS